MDLPDPRRLDLKRITRFMASGGGGGRALCLTANGIQVTVKPDYPEEQEAAEALADLIAALGPAEGAQREQPVTPTGPAAQVEPVRVLPFTVGESVYCNVHGVEGWYRVTEVGAARNHGRIKVDGTRGWCPASNFRRTEKR